MQDKLWIRLNEKKILRPYSVQEPQCVLIACNQHMLPIVDNIPCRLIFEGIGPTAEGWLLFDQCDGDSAAAELHGCGKAADAAADNDHWCFSHAWEYLRW